MSLSTPFIKRPVATSLLTIAIFLVGAVTFPLLPLAPLPQIEFPTVQVSASLPGASPETMASSVATPLENNLALIPGITQMSSSSGLGTTSITIQFDLDVNVDAAAQQVQSAINAAEAKMGKPATLTGNFQGTAQAFQSSLKSQPYLIAATIVTIYIILGMLYESFIHPFTILSTLPSAGLGALITLWIFGHDIGVMAIIGILLLIGIVKKNAIMMIDFAIDAERERNLPPEQAIFAACIKRFRPIIMTTIAAMLGGIPLALGRGDGSELRQPLGYAIVGGLILSQALTLFTTPVIYLYFDGLTRRLKEKRALDAANHS